jgi:hypothetical protein
MAQRRAINPMSDTDERNYDSDTPNQSVIARIAANATSARESLDAALTDIKHASEHLDIDEDICATVYAELEYWDQAVQALDEAIAADNLNFEVLDIEAKADTEQNAPPTQSSGGDANELLNKLDNQSSLIADLQKQISQLTQLATMTAGSAIAASPDDPYLNRVIVAADSGGNLKFPLDKNIMTIGREALNDIPIRSRFISRFHARIVSDRHGAIIEDLDSRNGITVNSERVRRQQLRSGDMISVGRTQLKYIDLSDSEYGEGQA